MSRGIKVINGVSKWVREKIGTEAANRGQDSTETDTEEDEENGDSNKKDSPVCCSAASNSDLTALEQ